MSRDGGRRSGGGRSGDRPPDDENRGRPPRASDGGRSPDARNDEHWSEAVRRRVRSVGEPRPEEGGAADREPAREAEPPGGGPGAAVRERVERRLRESTAPHPPSAAPRPSAAETPPGPGTPRPPDSPSAPPDAPGLPDTPDLPDIEDIEDPLGPDPPPPAEPAHRDPDRDWEDADWDEVARRGRRAAGDSVPGVVARLVATCGFIGRLPHAPGTFGALVGLAAVFLTRGLPPLTGAALFLGAAALGTWAAHRYAAASGRKDPPEVVVDEACGMWLAAFGAIPPADPAAAGGGEPIPFALLLGAFVLFRALDILKPPPLRQLERLPGGFGIMADDLAAGLVTRVLLFAFFGY